MYLDETNAFQRDIIFVSKDCNAILTESGCEGAPVIVVEILSPKTARLDLEPKGKAYARFGVRELWIIDPEKLRISIFEFTLDVDRRAKIHCAESTFVSAMFHGLEFSAPAIFRR